MLFEEIIGFQSYCKLTLKTGNICLWWSIQTFYLLALGANLSNDLPHIPQTGLLFRVGLALTETPGGGEKLKVGQMMRWPYNGKVFLTLK